MTVARRSGEAVITVSDTGSGIDAAVLPYIFEPFRQGKDGLSRVHGGLGLGLAVVHQLVGLHDGEVSVESRGAGQGSTFTIRLPETGLPRVDPCAEEGQLLLSGCAVLVIAASQDSREHLAAIVESSGGEVHTAESVEEAAALPPAPIDAVARDAIDSIVITDGPMSAHLASGDVRTETLSVKPVRPAVLVRQIAELTQKHVNR